MRKRRQKTVVSGALALQNIFQKCSGLLVVALRWDLVPFTSEAGCICIWQQTKLVTLLQEHAEAVATMSKSTRGIVRNHKHCGLVFISVCLRWQAERCWCTYLHLWSALSSSGVSLSKYWNATFTSSMKSWKIWLSALKQVKNIMFESIIFGINGQNVHNHHSANGKKWSESKLNMCMSSLMSSECVYP